MNYLGLIEQLICRLITYFLRFKLLSWSTFLFIFDHPSYLFFKKISYIFMIHFITKKIKS
jgi:hypothetical protein